MVKASCNVLWEVYIGVSGQGGAPTGPPPLFKINKSPTAYIRNMHYIVGIGFSVGESRVDRMTREGRCIQNIVSTQYYAVQLTRCYPTSHCMKSGIFINIQHCKLPWNFRFATIHDNLQATSKTDVNYWKLTWALLEVVCP